MHPQVGTSVTIAPSSTPKWTKISFNDNGGGQNFEIRWCFSESLSFFFRLPVMKSALCGWIWKILLMEEILTGIYTSQVVSRSLQDNHQIDSGPPTATVGLDMKGTWSWKWTEGLKDVTKLIWIKNKQQEDQGDIKRIRILHHLHFVKCDLLTAF